MIPCMNFPILQIAGATLRSAAGCVGQDREILGFNRPSLPDTPQIPSMKVLHQEKDAQFFPSPGEPHEVREEFFIILPA